MGATTDMKIKPVGRGGPLDPHRVVGYHGLREFHHQQPSLGLPILWNSSSLKDSSAATVDRW